MNRLDRSGLASGFDIIGDIHGHADALVRLLEDMDYAEVDGVYRHPTREAVFVGDFIDRGPEQKAVLRIARGMVETGAAKAVMGNHEVNAIAWATPDGRDGFLRPHTKENFRQHRAFLEQMGKFSDAHVDVIAWFKTLPLWLDLGGLRVIHACWHAPSQEALASSVDDKGRLTDRGLYEINDRDSVTYRAAELLLKGPEVLLPNGCSFHDKDGDLRHQARLRWWDPTATSFRTATLGMEGRESEFPDEPVPTEFFYRDDTPVLFGHYWMRGEPKIDNPRAACLDLSVAKGGCLTAYRWSGESELLAQNLVSVPAS